MFNKLSLSKFEYAFDCVIMGYAGYHVASGRYDAVAILAAGMLVTWAIRSWPSTKTQNN